VARSEFEEVWPRRLLGLTPSQMSVIMEIIRQIKHSLPVTMRVPRRFSLPRAVNLALLVLFVFLLSRYARNIRYDGPFPDSRMMDGHQKHLIDYHDYSLIEAEASRVGLGEHSEPAVPPGATQEQLDKTYLAYGFNGVLSDAISLNRSIEDLRHPNCKHYRYFAQLPSASVVVPFFEEHLATLQRTVVSVFSRSPQHLLKEVILVDDGSAAPELHGPLEEWVKKFSSKISIHRFKERQGLMAARTKGAVAATADVVVVLDSHCEVSTNWLPPLLHEIAADYRTTACPLIDAIQHDTFRLVPQDNGARGMFDWRLNYRRLPLFQRERDNLPKPFENPVMNGGLFAISKKFFTEIGGYDKGISIWGGEQYCISFKIWMCGGRLVDVPCSRVGHVFRGTPTKRPASNKKDFLRINYKRLGLVWMDKYIDALYRRHPDLIDFDAGDISEELQIKKRLQCKSFDWFLKEVAPDLVKTYPPFPAPDFANGTIRSKLHATYCLDTASQQSGPPILYGCHGGEVQNLRLTANRVLQSPDERTCIMGQHPKVSIYYCQLPDDIRIAHRWSYNLATSQLVSLASNTCLTAGTVTQPLFLSECSPSEDSQKWTFQYVNEELIKKSSV